MNEIENKLHSVTNSIVNELIQLTPEFMKEILFEIESTEDGGANIGLLENYPEVKNVSLSESIYTLCSSYLPLVREYVSEWKRTLITISETQEGWKVKVDFE